MSNKKEIKSCSTCRFGGYISEGNNALYCQWCVRNKDRKKDYWGTKELTKKEWSILRSPISKEPVIGNGMEY